MVGHLATGLRDSWARKPDGQDAMSGNPGACPENPESAWSLLDCAKFSSQGGALFAPSEEAPSEATVGAGILVFGAFGAAEVYEVLAGRKSG
ncbi:hypothetical protein AK812_SmicGene6348 [Symbiodinium microadriaticum]|uniref:Uncharacterized protein n=1 Tax=Symbiodinium microadriaticum TaxID=2951 RepID=A0A1Q9ERB1_SYMMI|nr:hypothetical protein AK812_SmicGene6348 [Symbiodinium microadriaticum]